MAGGGKIVCPVCDASLDVGTRRCPSCATDLSLFDLDRDGSPDADGIKLGSKEEVDAFLDSLGEEGAAEKLHDIATEVPGSEGISFACPACAADVDAGATACPSCGSTFADTGEVGCPSCGATVTPDATACEECGASFGTGTARGPPRRKKGPNLRPLLAEAKRARAAAAAVVAVPGDRQALFRELPKLVGEVKPMLLVGKQIGLDLVGTRTLINDAITKGKAREIEDAVRLVIDAKRSLHAAFTAEILRLVEAPVASLAAGETGAAEPAVEGALKETLELLRDGEYEASYGKARSVVQDFPASASAGPTRKAASQSVADTEAMFRDCEALGVSDPTGSAYLADAHTSLAEGENDEAARLAGKARDALIRRLPALLGDEMKSARDRLIGLKERGGDIARGIGRLKNASLHLRRKDYAAAARDLRQFREDMRAPGGERPKGGAPKGPKG